MTDFSKFLDASPTVREDKIITHLADLVKLTKQTNVLLSCILDATNLNNATDNDHGKESKHAKKRK